MFNKFKGKINWQAKADDAWNRAEYERSRGRGFSTPFGRFILPLRLSRKVKAVVIFFLAYLVLGLLAALIPISGKSALTGYLLRTITQVLRCLFAGFFAFGYIRQLWRQAKLARASGQAAYPAPLAVRPLSLFVAALLCFFIISSGFESMTGFYRYGRDRKNGPRVAAASLVDVRYSRRYGSRRARSVNPYIAFRLEQGRELVYFETDRSVARALRSQLRSAAGSPFEQPLPKFKITYYPATGVLKSMERVDDLTYLSSE